MITTFGFARAVAPGTSTARRNDALDLLADYTLDMRFDRIPADTVASALRCVLDCVTSAMAGAGSDGALAARLVAATSFGKGDHATVWFSDSQAPTAAAILANSTAASILDLDDGHRAATGHPGAAIIPVCLAVAEEQGSSWEELITAIVIGYEIAVRIAAGRDFERLDTMSTGKWCNYGVAAAVGRLRGLSREKLVHAMAVSGVYGPNQSAAGYSKLMGNHAKEGITWSTVTGCLAVSLAEAGFTGPTDILDHPAYFDRAAILRGLGRSFAIDRVYFKPYSCCRWAHAAIDGLTDIIEGDGLRWEAVKSVEVHTFERALKLNNECDPNTLEGAQYSVPFVLGVAAVKGRSALLPLTDKSLHHPDTVNFASRISLLVDDEINDAFPETTGARIVLKTATGKHMREVRHPLGDPNNPMPHAQLIEKFRTATRNLLSDERQNTVLAALDEFNAGDFKPLLECLKTALGTPAN